MKIHFIYSVSIIHTIERVICETDSIHKRLAFIWKKSKIEHRTCCALIVEKIFTDSVQFYFFIFRFCCVSLIKCYSKGR